MNEQERKEFWAEQKKSHEANRERVLDYYIEILAEYGIGEKAYSIMGFRKSNQVTMKNCLDRCDENKLDFLEVITKTENKFNDENNEYLEKDIKLANYAIRSLSLEVRKKMMKDMIEEKSHFEFNWKLVDEITKQIKDKASINKLKKAKEENKFLKSKARKLSKTKVVKDIKKLIIKNKNKTSKKKTSKKKITKPIKKKVKRNK